MAKNSDPFRPIPFTPRAFGGGSPLAATQRDFGPRIRVVNVEEQRRAEQVPTQIAAGDAAPTFKPTPTSPPYTEITPVPQPPKPQAGGSDV